MRYLKFVLFICFLGLTHESLSQIYLNEYKFGEGLNFSGEKGYSIRLDGYVQPYADTKKYLNTDDPDLYTRFRMRRIRLVLSGESENHKLKYRFKVDLSGTPEIGVEDEDNSGNFLLDAYVS